MISHLRMGMKQQEMYDSSSLTCITFLRGLLKEIASFRMWKCENVLSSLAYIDSLNVSVLTVYCSLDSAIYTISNKRKLHWLYMYADETSILIPATYVTEALARSRKLHVYVNFFLSAHLGGGELTSPPPPHTKKLATLLTSTIMCTLLCVYKDALIYILLKTASCSVPL